MIRRLTRLLLPAGVYMWRGRYLIVRLISSSSFDRVAESRTRVRELFARRWSPQRLLSRLWPPPKDEPSSPERYAHLMALSNACPPPNTNPPATTCQDRRTLDNSIQVDAWEDPERIAKYVVPSTAPTTMRARIARAFWNCCTVWTSPNVSTYSRGTRLLVTVTDVPPCARNTQQP